MKINEREPISKSLRFEVFKRDKFTCKYCGAKAPDAVLHVDHIKPVKDGGTNDPMNLVTACRACNAGKAARPLDANAVVTASRLQAEANHDEIEQLEMMATWHAEVNQVDESRVKFVRDAIQRQFDYTLTPYGDKIMARLVAKHGPKKFLDAVLKTQEWVDTRPAHSPPKAPAVFARLQKVMGYTELDSDPKSGGAYISGIIRNRFSVRWPDLLALKERLIAMLKDGASFQHLKTVACQCASLDEFEAELSGQPAQPR